MKDCTEEVEVAMENRIDMRDPKIAFSMAMVEKNPFMQWNRIVVDELDAEHSLCHVDLQREQTNPNGYAHGGFLFTIADANASALARADGRNYSTLDSDIHFLRNVKTGRLLGESRLIRRGKTSVLIDTQIRSEDGTLLVRATTTMFCIGVVVQ